MIIYTSKEKQIIGKFFYYYRKKRNVRWKEIKESKITSQTTYSRMEKGDVILDDSIYDGFLNFYHLKFTRKEGFDEWWNTYLPRINHALEYNNVDEIITLKQEAEKEFDGFQDVLIYEQYVQSLEHIFRYYVDGKYLTKEEILDDIQLLKMEFLPEVISVYLIEVMFISNNNSIGSSDIREIIFPELYNKYDNKVLDYVRGAYEKCNANFSTAIMYFDSAYEYFSEKGNKYRETRNYMGKYMIYKNTDPQKAFEMIPKLLELKREVNLDNKIKSSINYSIGMHYYLNKEYEKAYPFFVENYEMYHKTNVMIFMCSICSHLKIELPDWINSIDTKEQRGAVYLEFFKMKKRNESNEQLVNYIMKTIVPKELIHIPWTLPYWKMFEFELHEITMSQSKYYNTYIEYIEKMEKTCKDA